MVVKTNYRKIGFVFFTRIPMFTMFWQLGLIPTYLFCIHWVWYASPSSGWSQDVACCFTPVVSSTGASRSPEKPLKGTVDRLGTCMILHVIVEMIMMWYLNHLNLHDLLLHAIRSI